VEIVPLTRPQHIMGDGPDVEEDVVDELVTELEKLAVDVGIEELKIELLLVGRLVAVVAIVERETPDDVVEAGVTFTVNEELLKGFDEGDIEDMLEVLLVRLIAMGELDAEDDTLEVELDMNGELLDAELEELVAEDGIDELEDKLLEELEVDMDKLTEVIVDDMELVVVMVKLQIAPLTDPEL